MKCMDCPPKHIQQTSRIFHTRHKEHIQAIRHNSNSGHSNHILNTEHAYGSITDTMKIIKVDKKRKYIGKIPYI
jgi:glycyl-tRNA synthetase alpha subunit